MMNGDRRVFFLHDLKDRKSHPLASH